MPDSRLSSLTAYSASAGSGKTFRITREYLKLILGNAHYGHQYRHILAVTFTNKATQEMKSRIVLELDLLARGDSAKLADLCQEMRDAGTAISDQELQQRALEVRGNLLHDYSRFSVLTIDKFFQKILRAFVQDAGLYPGFNLELDTHRLLDEAVDLLLDNLDDDPQRKEWLLQYLRQRIDAGFASGIKHSLMGLGQELFKEGFAQLGADMHARLADKQFLNNYKHTLEQLVQHLDQQMQHIAQQAAAYMQAQGLTAKDFKWAAAGFIAHFDKLAQGSYKPGVRTLGALNNIDEWASKTDKTGRAQDAYPYLNPLLSQACQLWDTQGQQYNTAKAILQDFMVLGLLVDMATYIKHLSQQDNLLPISESGRLISGLLGDSDAPFLYEKIGNNIRTFMIDEFQDTSQVQWSNFLPLLRNSMAEQDFCMVVGDVKQSIYRWRNGDWRILAYGLQHDLGNFGQVQRKGLADNWRSLPTVVHFNNYLFGRVAAYLQASIVEAMPDHMSAHVRQELGCLVTDAYADCTQTPKRAVEGYQGFVQVELVYDNEEQKGKEQILERIPLLVAQLQDKGYKASDIAILTRNRTEGSLLAGVLMDYKQQSGDTAHNFDVVSQDSLFLRVSSVVQLCIALFRMAVGQEDNISEAFLQHEVERYIQGHHRDNMHSLFAQQLPATERKYLEGLTLLSLPEAFESIVKHYQLNRLEQELPFLQALHEQVLAYANGKMSDIAGFLQWWDDTGYQKPLQSPEGQDAITICTIHKSKGLQYRVVIVPFCSWELDTKTDSIVWMRTSGEPFAQLPWVPLGYGSYLNDTLFGRQRVEEQAKAYVDSLNLLYVALTRAEEQLYVFAPLKPAPKGREKATHMAHVLEDILAIDGQGGILQAAGLEGVGADTIWTFGQPMHACPLESKQPRQEIRLTEYPSEYFSTRLKVHYDAKDLLKEDIGSKSQRSYGTLMHKLFEYIHTASDIDQALARLVAEGWLETSQYAALREQAAQALQQPDIAPFFAGEWQVRNEGNILIPAQAGSVLIRRPDRVMIKDGQAVVMDYKFGQTIDPDHNKQVMAYMRYLHQMGLPQVKGYVWYVSLAQLQQVLISH